VSNNNLEGPLPTLPTSLISLDVSTNHIDGGLPSDMSAFTRLVDIQVSWQMLPVSSEAMGGCLARFRFHLASICNNQTPAALLSSSNIGSAACI
jgi:hypothetical protein